jgi:hypothetical protein
VSVFLVYMQSFRICVPATGPQFGELVCNSYLEVDWGKTNADFCAKDTHHVRLAIIVSNRIEVDRGAFELDRIAPFSTLVGVRGGKEVKFHGTRPRASILPEVCDGEIEIPVSIP